MKNIVLIVVSISTTIAAYSQNFQISKEPYVALDTSTSISLTPDTIWYYNNENYFVPLGFQVEIDGVTHDSIRVLKHGLIILFQMCGKKNNPEGNVLSVCFGELADLSFLNNSHKALSKIHYQTFFNGTENVFVLEYDSLGLQGDYHSYINFQLKIYEKSRKIQYHYGPSYVDPDNYDPWGFEDGPKVYFNYKISCAKNVDSTYIFLLTGNPADPQAQNLQGPDYANSPIQYIDSFPEENTVYTFAVDVVQNVPDVADKLSATLFYDGSVLHVASSEPTFASIRIVDIYGRECYTGKIEQGANEFSISHFPAGYYLVVLEGENGNMKTQKLLLH